MTLVYATTRSDKASFLRCLLRSYVQVVYTFSFDDTYRQKKSIILNPQVFLQISSSSAGFNFLPNFNFYINITTTATLTNVKIHCKIIYNHNLSHGYVSPILTGF